MRKILIAGNGIAAASALKMLLPAPNIHITVISPVFYPASYKPFFPFVSCGKLDTYETFLVQPEDYSRENITFKPGVKIQKLLAKKRIAYLSDGEEIDFDAALIATGSSVYIPEKFEKGTQRYRNLFTQDTIEEALNIRGLIEEGAKSCVVVGAGRTGVSVANAFASSGVSVSLLEKEKQILPNIIDGDLSVSILEKLEEKGVSIVTGASIEKVLASDRFIESIVLKDKTRIPCQIVIIATGSIPNIDFLEGNFTHAAGLIPNQYLETQEPGIFVAGDVVQFLDFNGKRKLQKLAINAWGQGEIAAKNILGEGVNCPLSFSGKYMQIDDIYAGYFGERDGTDYFDLSLDNNIIRFTFEGLKTTGMQFLSTTEKITELAESALNKFQTKSIPDEIKKQISSGFPAFNWHQKLFDY